MKKFIKKFEEKIVGTLGCFDRLLFKGHLPISSAGGMANFLGNRGVLFKDFRKYVQAPAQELKEYARNWAEQSARPYLYINNKRVRKGDLARKIAREDGISEGLVCVLAITEGCLSFRLKGHRNGPRLENARRKCLCLYFYLMHPQLGLIHVRIQTWFPFTIQVCVNGHHWLAKRMADEKIDFIQDRNSFTFINDMEKAQNLSDQFVKLPWVEILNDLAIQCNPSLAGLLHGMQYYWVCDQAEYATDVLFNNPEHLNLLYEKLLEHAIVRLGAKDILSFLDKVADGRFKGEQINVCRRRQMGARVRHWVKRNWINMYNKAGVLLRIETVINYPYDFKVYRSGIRKGEQISGWFPLSKNVTYLYRYEQIARTANGRYLGALSVQDDPFPAKKDLQELVEPVTNGSRRVAGFNPARQQDQKLFEEIMRAEYLVSGFCNADIRSALYGAEATRDKGRRLGSRVSRLFAKLHHRKLIAKIPRTRRWRITDKGYRILGALQALFDQQLPSAYAQRA